MNKISKPGFMRTELCRKCGTEMSPSKDVSSFCVVCRQPVRLACPKCNSLSQIQVHPHIFYGIMGNEPLIILNRR